MNDIERAKAEVFIEQTKIGLLKVVGSRLDAIKALLMPDAGVVIDCEVPETRPPMAHALKCWPRYFDLLWAGKKHAEVRRNDRDYRTGDYLVLREYNPARETYSGRWLVCKVDSVCDLDAVQLLDHVLMSLQFGLGGNGHRIWDHAHATAIAANDGIYQHLCRDQERWSAGVVREQLQARERRIGADEERSWIRVPPNVPRTGEKWEPRTYHPTIGRSESRGDERDPKTWTQPSPVRDMLTDSTSAWARGFQPNTTANVRDPYAESWPADPTALPSPGVRRIPISQPDGHADEPLPAFDRGPVS